MGPVADLTAWLGVRSKAGQGAVGSKALPTASAGGLPPTARPLSGRAAAP